MYQNIYYQRENNTIHLWDDEKGYLRFPYDRYGYKKAKNGRYTALDGTAVDKVKRWSKNDTDMYESDVRPEARVLIDMYGETDDISSGHRIMFFDIETLKDADGKYHDVSVALNVINSIAFYYDGKYTMLLLDESIDCIKKELTQKGTLIKVPTEDDLLMLFIHIFSEKIKPTIIVGWNSDIFDVPMLINRIKRKFGDNYAAMLSPINQIEKDRKYEQYTIAGVSSLDYMKLYKQYTYNEEPSYALDFISIKELGHGKITYIGSLDTLYKTDIEKFIEYNITDVSLLVELDDKLKFVDLGRSIAHKGHVPYGDIYTSIKVVDGACLTLLKRMGIVAPNKVLYEHSDTDEEVGFVGAFVKEPIAGRYEWVFDVDASGLYPSSQRTLNMSPETKIGKCKDFDFDKWKHDDSYIVYYKSKKYTKSEFKQWLHEKNYSIAPNGVMFDLNKKGLIPTILEKWAAERDDCRALVAQYMSAGNIELGNIYNAKQMSLKIISNTLYGVLGNKGFRFYDLDNAEATTLTGQHVTKFAHDNANLYMNAMLKTDNVDYTIYVDTDSCNDSLIRCEKYGDIMLSELYNKYVSGEYWDLSNRRFVFPTDVKIPYFNEDTASICYGSVHYIEKHKVKKKMYKITCVNGKSITVTEDHSVMVLTDFGLIEKKPIELLKTDKIISIITKN